MTKFRRSFFRLFGDGGDVEFYFAPGRMNLIGEHLDYNGGLVFPAAITMGIHAAVRKNEDGVIRFRSKAAEGEFTADLRTKIDFSKISGWGIYPLSVVQALQDEEKPLAGCDVLFESNLPQGSGLSSSAAIEVLTAYILLDLIGEAEKTDLFWLAELCRRAENEYVGVQCGIMDQFACAMGENGKALLLDTKSREYEKIPVSLGNYRFLLMHTGCERKLGESKFNERRNECEQALSLMNQSGKNYKYLAEMDESDLKILDEYPVLRKRARHVLTENERVKRSVDLLNYSTINEFGELLDQSHFSLRDDYEVSGEALDVITNLARNCPGCYGSRMTGAGFGGTAIALVDLRVLPEFIAQVKHAYIQQTGLNPEFWVSALGRGVQKLNK